MIPFIVKVAVEERNDKQGVYKNVIRSYKNIAGASTMAGGADNRQPHTGSVQTPTPAWRRNAK
jgi:hypothetical protein